MPCSNRPGGPIRYHIVILAALLSACAGATPASHTWVDPLPGESHLQNIRQLTFGGNNAEAYFSADGQWLVFQRAPDLTKGCDQEYVMK
ncbi:MAG: hypothetical protein WBC97_09445, partial [Gemmatimonadales bacterium]